MQIYQSGDGKISIDDDKPFVDQETSGVDPGDEDVVYRITGPDNYVIAVEAGTPVAPEFRDNNGDPCSSSTRITIQKADKQGNPLGGGIVFSATLGDFNFSKMRSDADYLRTTDRDLMLDEHEQVLVKVSIPSGDPPMDVDNSRLTIGDETSDIGKPVEIVDHDSLSDEESEAVKRAANGN